MTLRWLRWYALLALSFLAPVAMAQEWEHVDGKLTDLSFGANGTLWGVAPVTHKAGGAIYRREGSSWRQVPGLADRIAVDPAGNPWVVNSHNEIYRYDGAKFVRVNGAARDIGIGAEGSVWIVGADQARDGSSVYRRDGDTWTKVPGSANRIAVDGSGNAWIVSRHANVFRFNGASFEPVTGITYKEPGHGRDIAVSADGRSVWLVGPNARIYHWNGTETKRLTGHAYSVTVASDGTAWVASNMGAISKWTGKPPPSVDPNKRWQCEVSWKFGWTDRNFEGWGPSKSVAIGNARFACMQQSFPAEKGICAGSYLDEDCTDHVP